jgi:hypothetical protein
LLDASLVHDADLVGHGEGLVLVVRYEDRGGAAGADDVAHLVRQALAQVDIEVRKRLVEQQELGPRGERARQRNALLLATRDLVRVFLQHFVEPGQLGELAQPRRALRLRRVVQAEGDVVRYA